MRSLNDNKIIILNTDDGSTYVVPIILSYTLIKYIVSVFNKKISQSGYETAVRTETPRPDQPVPGRAQGPDGGHAAGRRRERQQAGKSRHT